LKEGDLLAYTGILGESNRDLEKLFRGEEIAGDSRFLEPALRAEFIERARPYLQAGMDISDGLFCDTNKLLDINKYGMNILKDINQEMGDSGEEYEMLVGFQKRDKEEILSIARALNLPLNIFAEVAKNRERFPCKSHHFQ
jgi:thiamine-monophosphate kinase